MSPRTSRTMARDLTRRYNINVNQERYREDGKWYHHLDIFPAAFLDANGYIIFQSETEYNQCQYLNQGQDVNVIGNGISSIPGYKLFRDREIDMSRSDDETSQHSPGYTTEFSEGAIIEMTVELKKRDPRLRSLAIQKYGAECQVCKFNFSERYGTLGEGYIEVHHLKPLSLDRLPRIVTVDDVAVVCANCHRMLHRKGRTAMSIQELKTIVQ